MFDLSVECPVDFLDISPSESVSDYSYSNVEFLSAQAIKLLSTDPALALLLSIEASHIEDNYSSRNALLSSIQANLPIIYSEAGAISATFSPNGSTLAIGMRDGSTQ